jgi:hypothetical protein
MPRNAGKATPKDLVNTLAKEEDVVTRVRASINGFPGACACLPAVARAFSSCAVRICEHVACAVPLFAAEPVDGFRVSAGSAFKAKVEEWRGPNEYTSCLRNLLQRHFKKVTMGEWFASGAILVPMAEANSVERTWGRGARNPHPKWETIAWEVVRVSSSSLPAESFVVWNKN